jgi:hypothetical protein
VRWLEVVADLEAAKLGVKKLVECVPGEYFISSLASGRRLGVKALAPPKLSSKLFAVAQKRLRAPLRPRTRNSERRNKYVSERAAATSNQTTDLEVGGENKKCYWVLRERA